MLGKRVRHARYAARMTQETLAHLTGLRQSHISRIEKGTIDDVVGDTLKVLATALKVSPGYLLGLEEAPVQRGPMTT